METILSSSLIVKTITNPCSGVCRLRDNNIYIILFWNFTVVFQAVLNVDLTCVRFYFERSNH